MGIESYLSDEPNEPTVEPIVQEPQIEPEPAAPEVARDEVGRFAPKGVEEGAPPAPVDKLPQEEFKALKDERSKRQTLESELASLKQQIEAIKNPPPPPVSVFEDEQGWQQQFGSQVVNQAVSQASLNAKLDMSEMMVRQANPDFEDMKTEFLRLSEENPSLRQQALADPHPWNKAYQIAKNYKTMQELGATDLDGLKEKLRAEIQAEMQAQQQPAPRQSFPTLSTERNVGSRAGPAWAGPKSLSDYLS